MSTESSAAEPRPYRKRRRAELEDATRLRITEAAVDLHGSVGPARTTIRGVAERAGVQRATVYRHFADEVALFQACSSHWATRHPLPDTAAWAAIADPDDRLRMALQQIYAWHEQGEYMLEKVIRDAPLVPALQPAVAAFRAALAEAADVIVRGRPERGARRRRVRAAVGHALAFETWRSLVRDQRLSAAEATKLMESLVAGAAEPASS